MTGATTRGFDVVVIGEPLLELSSDVPLEVADCFHSSFSGDALNEAAAAAAAGAHVALLTRVGDDEFGDALCAYATRLNIDVSQVVRTPEPNGVYFTALDPDGERHFVYLRRGSAASTMDPGDFDDDLLASSGVLLVSGIGCAISESAEATIQHAAKTVNAAGGKVVYDPNFRARLVDVGSARRHMQDLGEFAYIVTPSCPHDTEPLFGTSEAQSAIVSCHDAGAEFGLVTLGNRGVLLSDGEHSTVIPAEPAIDAVDATGCGDAFTGALAAGIAAGTSVEDATRSGVQMASRCLGGRGGTGYLLNAVDTPPSEQQQDSPREERP